MTILFFQMFLGARIKVRRIQQNQNQVGPQGLLEDDPMEEWVLKPEL